MTTADDLLARRPDLAAPLDAYRASLRAAPLDAALLERCALLVQRRIARTSEPGAGQREDARTRAVLTFADQFVIDPHGIDDDMRDAVLDHLAPAELAVLVQWLAITDGLARFSTVLAGVGT